MREEVVTSDLAAFGFREREMAEELLKAWRVQGLPKGFYGNAVTIAMNTNSGYVFLTNADYDAAMMNGDKLESFWVCPECGNEGFTEDLKDGEKCCKKYLRENHIK